MKIAIIDLGSARTKVTIAESLPSGDISYITSLIDISLAEAQSESPATLSEVMAYIHRTAVNIARAAGASRVAFVGAQAFRDSDLLVGIAKNVMPSFSVVSPAVEGNLFFVSTEIEDCLSDFSAIDIGGGSVQFVWGRKASQSVSNPVGTFYLERSFQRNTRIAIGPGTPEWTKMGRAIETSFSEVTSWCPRTHTLAVGSNVMRDFFSSALYQTGISRSQNGRFTSADAYALAVHIEGKKYEDSYNLFPQNPKFIHGADKLLIVVTTMMEMLSCTYGAGTNASTSKGIAQLLIRDPRKLHNVGIDSLVID